ncbi:MAG: hypothetical protein WDN26_20035 [Chitinophagaceae bacterium]
MKTTSVLFNEEQLLYLQDTLKVSREDLVQTIRLSHISATDIANCVRTRKEKAPKRPFLSNYCSHMPDILKLFHFKKRNNHPL